MRLTHDDEDELDEPDDDDDDDGDDDADAPLNLPKSQVPELISISDLIAEQGAWEPTQTLKENLESGEESHAYLHKVYEMYMGVVCRLTRAEDENHAGQPTAVCTAETAQHHHSQLSRVDMGCAQR